MSEWISGKGFEMIEEATKSIIQERLMSCTLKQISLFNQIYKSVDELPTDKYREALGLIERTIRSNEDNPREVE